MTQLTLGTPTTFYHPLADAYDVPTAEEVNAVIAAGIAASGRSGLTDALAVSIWQGAPSADAETEADCPPTLTDLEYMLGGTLNLPRDDEGQITAF